MTSRLTPVGLVFLVGTAHAQLIVPISQERWVEAYVKECYGYESTYQEATDFGLFDASVESDDYYYTSTASASQASIVLGDAIACDASADGLGDDFCGCSTGEGTSYFRVVFELQQDVHYSFDGYTAGWSYGGGDVRLTSVNTGAVLASSSSGYNEFDDFQSHGVLQPGRYVILVDAGGGATACDLQYEGGAGSAGCSLTLIPVGEQYCVSSPNSAGAGAVLAYSGSQDLSENDFALEASGLPAGVSGLFFFGPNQIQTPFGDGVRCVGGTTRRLQPPGQADGSGDLTRALDFGLGAAADITAATPWNFQLWYRDPMGPGGTGFNTSDGLSVVFQP